MKRRSKVARVPFKGIKRFRVIRRTLNSSTTNKKTTLMFITSALAYFFKQHTNCRLRWGVCQLRVFGAVHVVQTVPGPRGRHVRGRLPSGTLLERWTLHSLVVWNWLVWIRSCMLVISHAVFIKLYIFQVHTENLNVNE